MMPFSFPEEKGDVFPKTFLEAVWSKNARYTSTGSSIVTDFGMKHLCNGSISTKIYPSLKLLGLYFPSLLKVVSTEIKWKI